MNNKKLDNETYYMKDDQNRISIHSDEHKSKNMNFIKQNWFKLLIVLIIIVTLGISFYWNNIRVAQIKQDCSWAQRHTDEIKYQPTSPNLSDCLNSGGNSIMDELRVVDRVGRLNKCYGVKYQPAKDWLGPATDDEYKFCLHSKGL